MQHPDSEENLARTQECREALQVLIDRLESYDLEKRRENLPDRSLGCTLLDLDVTFYAWLRDGSLVGLTREPNPKPDFRILCTSDDLLAMVNKDLSVVHAWGTGRLRVDASFRDLLRLRRMATNR